MLTVDQNDIWRYNPSAENISEPNMVTKAPGYKRIKSIDGLRYVKFSIRFTF